MQVMFTCKNLYRCYRQAGSLKLFLAEVSQSRNRGKMELIHNSLKENKQLIRRIDERLSGLE